MTTHDTLMALVADLRSRINPAYATQLGTESYERRICAEAIEALIADRDEHKANAMRNARSAVTFREERDANAKDAARYRWIREGDGDNQVMTYVVGLDDWTPWSCPEDVDAAIDTALKLGL